MEAEMIDIIKKIMYAYDDLPELVQAFIFISLVIFFWEAVLQNDNSMAKKPNKKIQEEYKQAIKFGHHQGSQGIHYLGNFTWEDKYGTQEELLEYYEKNK